MKSIPYENGLFRNLPREQQLHRMNAVIRQELTERQRQILLAYYSENKTLDQIARERNVNKSTVCRTLKRAEERIRRFLLY